MLGLFVAGSRRMNTLRKKWYVRLGQAAEMMEMMRGDGLGVADVQGGRGWWYGTGWAQEPAIQPWNLSDARIEALMTQGMLPSAGLTYIRCSARFEVAQAGEG